MSLADKWAEEDRQRIKRIADLEAENARLQADVKEAREHWRRCEEGWNKAIKQTEGFLRERDRYKAQAERRGETLEAVEWRGGPGGMQQCPRCNMPRSSGHAPYCLLAAALAPEEER